MGAVDLVRNVDVKRLLPDSVDTLLALCTFWKQDYATCCTYLSHSLRISGSLQLAMDAIMFGNDCIGLVIGW